MFQNQTILKLMGGNRNTLELCLVEQKASLHTCLKHFMDHMTLHIGGLDHQPIGPWPLGPLQNLAKRAPSLQ